MSLVSHPQPLTGLHLSILLPPSAGITGTITQPTTWSLFQWVKMTPKENFLAACFLSPFISCPQTFPTIRHSIAQAPRWQAALIFYLFLHPSPGHCWPIGSTPKCPNLPKPLPPFILTPRFAGWFICVSCFLFSLPVWSWTGVGANVHTCATAEQHLNLCPFPESPDASTQQLEWDCKQFPCLRCQSLSLMLRVTPKFVSGFRRPKTDSLSELLCPVLWSFLTSWEWQFYFNCRAFALAVTILSWTMT